MDAYLLDSYWIFIYFVPGCFVYLFMYQEKNSAFYIPNISLMDIIYQTFHFHFTDI